jgi:hypothetical protein
MGSLIANFWFAIPSQTFAATLKIIQKTTVDIKSVVPRLIATTLPFNRARLLCVNSEEDNVVQQFSSHC